MHSAPSVQERMKNMGAYLNDIYKCDTQNLRALFYRQVLLTQGPTSWLMGLFETLQYH